jgi:hypothetical protein
MAAVDPNIDVNTNKIKRYDIFKNTVKNDPKINEIKQILANLSVADTSHDIDKKDKGVLGITTDLNNAANIQAIMYKTGIPIAYDEIPSEEEAISSVIKDKSFEWVEPTNSNTGSIFTRIPYVPLFVMKYIKEGKVPTGNARGLLDKDASEVLHPDYVKDIAGKTNEKIRTQTQHKVETKNGNKYVVTYFDVKPEKIAVNGIKTKGDTVIDAQTFFQRMGYTPTSDTKNIAFIVDCTSVKFEDILNTGTKIPENFKTYLIKSPEGENDPGGKTNLQDKTFKVDNMGVRYRAAVPHNLTKSHSYVYSYGDSKISSYTQFFTNYCFNLSELQFDDKYIFSSLSTTINITDPRNTAVPTKTVLNSGDMNEIGAVSTVVRNILEKIAKFKNKYSLTDSFDYNCALQQKRSGDWLQALLTCLVASGQRNFCEYNSPQFNLASIFKKKEVTDGTKTASGANNPVLTFEPQDVYLVTHDRILLAFALLLGINVIFTHHYTGTGKGYSFHSALVYKIEDPLEKSQSKLKVMEDFFKGVKGLPAGSNPPFDSVLESNMEKLMKMYGRFITHIVRYKNGVPLLKVDNTPEDGQDGILTEDNLNKYIIDFTERISTTNVNPITTDIINQYTQKIFALAFKIALIKTTFPDLDSLANYLEEINKLKTEMTRIKEKLTTNNFETYKHPQQVTASEADYFLQLDSETLSYDKIVKLLSKYNEISNRIEILTKNFAQYGSFIGNMEKGLKKNPTFGLILAWRTTNVPKYNLWVQYNNVLKVDSAYINDKNIFLYELTKLDDDLKQQICTVYYNLFEKIKIPANIAGNASLQAKTQQNVLSFCLEVFVNLGPFIENDALRSNIKYKIDRFLSSRLISGLILQKPAENAPHDTSTAEKIFKPNRFAEVIAELNALNATKIKYQGASGDSTINAIEIFTLEIKGRKNYEILKKLND